MGHLPYLRPISDMDRYIEDEDRLVKMTVVQSLGVRCGPHAVTFASIDGANLPENAAGLRRFFI